ncbi:hypothetical protein [Streptomyces sp. DT195]
MGWHREPLIGFDLETTGTDPRQSRIVTGTVPTHEFAPYAGAGVE